MANPTIDTVFTLLNQFDPSKLRALIEPIVLDMKNPALTEPLLDSRIREALEKSQYPFIPLENAEIKINGAMAKYHRQKYYDAQVLFEEVLSRYEEDFHRKAVTCWLLGFNALALENLFQAYDYWFQARETLIDLSKGNHLNASRPEKLDWYKKQLKIINKLMASTCIQEIHGWFDSCGASHLDAQAISFYGKIQDAIAHRRNLEAHQLIDSLERLAELSKDHEQAREVQVYCGVAKYQLGSAEEAVKYFNKAIALLTPGSHRQAVTYWLAGYAQCHIPRLREEGIHNLNQSILLTKKLRFEADSKHNTTMMNWYDEKLLFMQEFLKDRLDNVLK